MSIPNYYSHSQKNLKVFAVCLLAVSVLSLALALLKTTGVILKPKQTEAMKGSESVGGRYLKEESYWERYGVSPEGLVLWLSQSDARSYGDSANWYDLSGYGNHGAQTTAANQPAITSGSGLAGFARSFDGSNDYVKIGGAVNSYIVNTVTIAFWLKSNSATQNSRVFMNKSYDNSTEGFMIQLVETSMNTKGSGVTALTTSGNPITANKWHFVVVTCNGITATFYINGIYNNSGSINQIVASTSGYFKIGKLGSDTGGYYLDGLIDDVRIYNRALTAAEIEKLYLADKPRYGGM